MYRCDHEQSVLAENLRGKHPSGEGWFSRYDATAMLSMRPCTALQADATSVDPRKWSDTTRRWISMSMVKCFSTKRFDSGSTIHHVHKLSSDDELRQKWQLSRKEVARIMKFPRGDDAQRRKG
jgi:hypothetical protein